MLGRALGAAASSKQTPPAISAVVAETRFRTSLPRRQPSRTLRHVLPPRGENPTVSLPVDVRDAPQEKIGPYRILSLIAEGGMGAVYLAEQQTPQRRVALKVIKAGMDTRHVVARFETEREALALMDRVSPRQPARKHLISSL